MLTELDEWQELQNEMGDYFSSIKNAYDHYYLLGENTKKVEPCNSKLLSLMLEANQSDRSPAVDIYIREHKKEAGFSDVKRFIEELSAQIPKKGTRRAQLIVNNKSHFTVLDFKFSNDKKECIVLDAGGDLRGALLGGFLSTKLDDVYYPEKGKNGQIPVIQRDFHSCPFFSMVQAAELSHIDIYDYLRELTAGDEENLHTMNWEDMPAQLARCAQGDASKFAGYAEVFDARHAHRDASQWMPGDIFVGYVNNNIKESRTWTKKDGSMPRWNGTIEVEFDRISSNAANLPQERAKEAVSRFLESEPKPPKIERGLRQKLKAKLHSLSRRSANDSRATANLKEEEEQVKSSKGPQS